jgi:hypothetical protein
VLDLGHVVDALNRVCARSLLLSRLSWSAARQLSCLCVVTAGRWRSHPCAFVVARRANTACGKLRRHSVLPGEGEYRAWSCAAAPASFSPCCWRDLLGCLLSCPGIHGIAGHANTRTAAFCGAKAARAGCRRCASLLTVRPSRAGHACDCACSLLCCVLCCRTGAAGHAVPAAPPSFPLAQAPPFVPRSAPAYVPSGSAYMPPPQAAMPPRPSFPLFVPPTTMSDAGTYGVAGMHADPSGYVRAPEFRPAGAGGGGLGAAYGSARPWMPSS